jgi:ribonuclease HI
MVYTMKIYVDGGCRGNGQPGSIGAAAVAFKLRYGRLKGWHRSLPRWPPPTNQRAEISAIILALEKALEKYDNLYSSPRLNVKIYTDSKYAVGCMRTWIDKWISNGWKNAAGNTVANRDLIAKASDLDDKLLELGKVKYIWIPREDNVYADSLCNDNMDGQVRF